MLRQRREELHAWVTSTSWSAMNVDFVKEIHGNIYTSKVNGIIPWAGIQRPPHWVGGDPNPGSAIRVNEDGSYEVAKGYYFYKQVSRAGQAGMAVCETFAMDSEVAMIGFSGQDGKQADSFVLIHLGKQPRDVAVAITGCGSRHFDAFRTTDDQEDYRPLGEFALQDGQLTYHAPARSVTTFFAK